MFAKVFDGSTKGIFAPYPLAFSNKLPVLLSLIPESLSSILWIIATLACSFVILKGGLLPETAVLGSMPKTAFLAAPSFKAVTNSKYFGDRVSLAMSAAITGSDDP